MCVFLEWRLCFLFLLYLTIIPSGKSENLRLCSFFSNIVSAPQLVLRKHKDKNNFSFNFYLIYFLHYCLFGLSPDQVRQDGQILQQKNQSPV